jgi:hypothetical protein
MKHSIKGLFVILAIVMSFVLVQGVWANEITVEDGNIVRIGTKSIDVVTDSQAFTFYHIPFNSLEAANIPLAVGDSVTISAYVVIFPNGETKYIGYKIIYDDITYEWHPDAFKAGKNDLDSVMAVSDDCVCNDNCYCNCPKDCPDCPCDCLCDCICDGDGPKGPNGPKN